MGVRYLDFRPDMRIEHALWASRGTSSATSRFWSQRAGALLRERMHPFITAFASERLDALALRVPAGPDAKAPDLMGAGS